MSISAKDLTLDFVNADPFISLVHDLPAQEDKRGVEHDVDEGVDHSDQDEPNADGNPGAPRCNSQEEMILSSSLSWYLLNILLQLDHNLEWLTLA